MMEWIIGLYLVGALLIFLEAFVPGGILGLAGGISLMVGVVLCFVGFGAQGGLLGLIVAGIVVGLTLYFEFKILPKTWIGKRFFLTGSNHDGTVNVTEARKSLIGSKGKAVTPLRPSGVVLLGDRREEAFSESGYLDADTPVRVVAADAFKLTVVRDTNSVAKPAGIS